MKPAQADQASKQYIFTNHVPNGFKPCEDCCADNIYVPPVKAGYFRDLDVDFGVGRFGVCSACAGTGIKISLSHTVRKQLIRWRFARNDIYYNLQTRKREIAFLKALLQDRKHCLRQIDKCISHLSSIDRLSSKKVRELTKCAQFLDLLMRYNNREGYEAVLRSQVTHKRRVFRMLLTDAKEKIGHLLLDNDSDEADESRATIQQMIDKQTAKAETLRKKLNRDLLPEEFLLLLAVRYYWIKVGSPDHCYAKNLVEYMERKIGPLIPTLDEAFQHSKVH